MCLEPVNADNLKTQRDPQEQEPARDIRTSSDHKWQSEALSPIDSE